MHSTKQRILFLLIVVVLVASAARAEVGGKITGVAKDQTGSVIPGAAVFITNTQTGAKLAATTDQDGVFTFPVLSVGQYQIDVTSDAFKPYRKTGLIIDINSALVLDVTLQVKDQDQSIVVTENPAQVETTDTQLGQVLGSKKVTEIPLNGRSYTDLFATQVGVTPLTTSGAGNSTSGGGFGTVPVAGATNTGQFSINGQREDANGFSLNGASVQEGIGQQAGIIPNLDSIAEFRILTSNTDAEYGNYSGGLINVVTKSGGNAFHGSVFEFLRNTDLDAKNYFSTQRSVFQQNQYGGTLGGPIKQNKLFFFGDYQGQRTKQGQGYRSCRRAFVGQSRWQLLGFSGLQWQSERPLSGSHAFEPSGLQGGIGRALFERLSWECNTAIGVRSSCHEDAAIHSVSKYRSEQFRINFRGSDRAR